MTEASQLYRQMEKECPAFQARATARALTRHYNACFRPLGITAEQFSLLVGIGGGDEPTIAELAARAGIDATTLSRSVKSLEQKNLILNRGGRGRAGKRLALTAAGQALMADAVTIWACARAKLADALSEQMLREASLLMSQIATAANHRPLVLDADRLKCQPRQSRHS